VSAHPENRVILRTEDGTRFEYEDSSMSIEVRESSGHGKLIRASREELDEAIYSIVRTVRRAFDVSGARRATVQFGVNVHPQAGYIVSQGQESAHLVFNLEFGQP